MVDRARAFVNLILALGVLTFPVVVHAQAAPEKKPQTRSTEKRTTKGDNPNPLADQRRTVAISLLTSLADESRSYQDQTLRARVQARAADALWDSDGAGT